MSLRSAVIFSVALLAPFGAHAQADQESINMCIQQVCLRADSEEVVREMVYGECLSQAGNPNCDSLLFAVEAARSECRADCTNDPDGLMGN